jgi:hypothetical protein
MAHGTWQQTGGGGDGWKALAILGAVVLIGCSGAAAAVTGAIEGILLAIAVTVAVFTVAAAALLGWWLLRGKPAGEARAEAVRLNREHARAVEAEQRAAVRHQRALELAAAQPGTVIQNVIDPALLVAAALRVQPQTVPVLRGEVER